MRIKNYDMYQFKLHELGHININSIYTSEAMYYIRMFFLYEFKRVRSLLNLTKFIKEIEDYPQNTFLFEDFAINFDIKNNLIYLREDSHQYDDTVKTSEIEELFENDKFIELCNIGFLDYMTIPKDNFFNLLFLWDKICNQAPVFVLLYQDEKDLYDLIAFETQQAMEKFVADHIQKI